MGRLIEGLWDCRYCDTKGIGGSKKECPNCGKVRDFETKFYFPSENRVYVSEEDAKKINRNPDWLCQYCDTLNSASETVCKQCGAPWNPKNLNYFQNQELRKKQEESSNVDSNVEAYTYSSNTKNNVEADTYSSNIKSNGSSFIRNFVDFILEHLSFLIFFVAIAMLVAGLIWIFTPKTKEVTVNNLSWERSIDIERYQTVNESAWSLPEGARLHETRREIYTHRQELDHYEHKTREVAKKRISGYEEKVVGHRDLGNGYFEEVTQRVPVYETYYETEHYDEPVYRSVPVYKDKYYYEIDRWLYDRTLTTSAFDKKPYWHDLSDLGEDERESKRKEKYFITYIDSKGKMKEISLPYIQWNDLNRGDKIKIKVSIFGTGELV